MEERIIDDPRKIKITRTAAGGVGDATDELAPDAEREEEEIVLDLPEGDDYDEDLVGLSPTQLQEELKRREKAAEEARAERDKLLAEAERALAAGDYAAAEPFFSQAMFYDPGCFRAHEGVWIARTRNFKDTEPFYDLSNAEEVSNAPAEVKAFLREKAGAELREARRAMEEEAAPLRETFSRAQEERRGAFRSNRKYYLVRFSVFAALFALCLLGAGISAYFIVRTTTIIPVALTIAFGALALVMAVVMFVFLRKLVIAVRLCRDNEMLSSTEEGQRLSELENRILCLKLVLDDET